MLLLSKTAYSASASPAARHGRPPITKRPRKVFQSTSSICPTVVAIPEPNILAPPQTTILMPLQSMDATSPPSPPTYEHRIQRKRANMAAPQNSKETSNVSTTSSNPFGASGRKRKTVSMFADLRRSKDPSSVFDDGLPLPEFPTGFLEELSVESIEIPDFPLNVPEEPSKKAKKLKREGRAINLNDLPVEWERKLILASQEDESSRHSEALCLAVPSYSSQTALAPFAH